MPAPAVSPTTPLLSALHDLEDQLEPLREQVQAAPTTVALTLMTVLRTVADPRSRSGRRHPLPGILGLAICAVLAGTGNDTQIHTGSHDIDDTTRTALELSATLPSETTIGKTLQRLDADALDLTLGAWVQSRLNATTAPGHRRVIAVDGKAVRGSATPTAVAKFLMSAIDTARGVVLGHVDVGAKTNKILLFAPHFWTP